MDINVQNTSLDAYSMYRAAGNNLGKAILEYLKVARTPKADFEIMEFFNQPRNVVSAARNKLYREGSAVEACKKTDPGTGRKVIAWKYCPDPVPIEDKSAKIILTEIRKIIKNVDNDKFSGHIVLKGEAFDKIKDLVFSKKAIVLPLK